MDVEFLQTLFVTANTPNPSGVYTVCKLLLKLESDTCVMQS
jgi:hypothetical protein